MTTYAQALSHLDGEPTDALKDVVRAAVNDPIVRRYPEVTGHDIAVLNAAGKISEAAYASATNGDGEINGLVLHQALTIVIARFLAEIPDDFDSEASTTEAMTLACTWNAKCLAYEKMDRGDTVGTLMVDGNAIPVTKIED